MNKALILLIITLYAQASFSMCTDPTTCEPAQPVPSDAVPALVNLMWMTPVPKAKNNRYFSLGPNQAYRFNQQTNIDSLSVAVTTNIPSNHLSCNWQVNVSDTKTKISKALSTTIELNQPQTGYYTILLNNQKITEAKNSTPLSTTFSQPTFQSAFEAALNNLTHNKMIQAGTKAMLTGIKIDASGVNFALSAHHDCAGTLLAYSADKKSAYVLTAAHCTVNFNDNGTVASARSPENLRVTFGDSWIIPGSTEQPTAYSVSNITRSSSYSAITDRNHDFAILTIKNPPQDTKPFKLVDGDTLALAQQYSNSLYAIGWGRNTLNSHMPSVQLYTGHQAFVPPTECIGILNQSAQGLAWGMTDKTLCAGSIYDATTDTPAIYSIKTPLAATCPGDSGDPLFIALGLGPEPIENIQQWNANTRFFQFGTNSFNATSCTSRQLPGNPLPTPTVRANVLVLCNGQDDLLSKVGLTPQEVCQTIGDD